MKRFLFVILILTIICSISSCSSKKHLINNELQSISANRLINEVEQNNFVFDKFQAKFNAKVETPDANLSLKGQLRMKNDSIVWISVSLPIGVEVIRGIITKDSVFMINRTDKTYVKESIKHFKQIPPQIAEIGFLQSILVGNDNSLKSNKYKVEIADGKYNLLTSNKITDPSNNNEEIGSASKNLAINPETFKICKLIMQESLKKTRKVELNYDEFETIEGMLIPTEIKLEMIESQSFHINISYSNIILNTEQDYKFSIPKKFTLAK